MIIKTYISHLNLYFTNSSSFLISVVVSFLRFAPDLCAMSAASANRFSKTSSSSESSMFACYVGACEMTKSSSSSSILVLYSSYLSILMFPSLNFFIILFLRSIELVKSNCSEMSSFSSNDYLFFFISGCCC